LGLGRYRYVRTPSVPFDRLVVREEAPDGVEAWLAGVLLRPFDRDLPLWRVHLVDQPDGRQFVVLSAHHAFAGGYAAVELIERFLGAEESPSTAADVRPPARVPVSARAVDAAWGIASLGYRIAARLRPGARWAPARACAPLVGPIERDRAVAFAPLPAHRLAAIGDAHGAGRTRVVLAVIARALEPLAADLPSLRALFPHGTQVGAVTGPGNAGRSAFLDLPLHLEPGERLAAIRDAIARSGEEQHGPAVADLTLSIPPTFARLAVLGRRLEPVGTVAPLRVCAHPLTRLTVVGQGHADGITLTFTADASLRDELPGIAGRVADALTELEQSALVAS
jgi:hypothetical protein